MCTWFGDLCLACGERSRLSPDHVVPLVQGGANDISNIQPLCLSCNLRKSTKTIDYRDPDRLAAFLEHIQC
jgi:5-methylcytosine-specific restriction endonuclease McrA